MADADQVDAVVLAAVESFLDECTEPHLLLGEESPKWTSSDDELVLASHRLLAETETNNQQDETVNASELNSTDGSNGEGGAQVLKDKRDHKAAKRRQRYRLKLKAEEAMLTRQESELSLELSLLQARKKEMMKQTDCISLRTWRTSAMIQRGKRVEAEKYRKLLRTAVVNRSRAIHQMKVLMVEAIQTETLSSSNMPPDDSATLLKAFVRELDSIYARTDADLRCADFKWSYPMVYQPVRQNEKGLQIYESADRTVLPFEFEKVSRALSKFMLDTKGCAYTVKTEDPTNISAVKYDLLCALGSGDSTTLSGYFATKRYQEADRLVIVWQILFEGQDKFAGLHSVETGWTIICPSSEEVTGQSINGVDNMRSTALMSFSRVIPMGTGNAPTSATSDVSAEKFGEIVIKAGEDGVKMMMEMLDNMLITTL